MTKAVDCSNPASGSTSDPSHSPPPLRISVVIPHLNQPEALARCLASLARGVRQADEVLVVDNGSAQPPTDICATHGARLLHEATPGPGPARNRGVAEASGAVLAFIDADCIAAPDWLATAEAVLTDPEAAILGGDVRIALADPARVTVLEAYESIYAYRMDIYIRRRGFTGTGNLVVRRAVLDHVGPFAGLGVAEDIDWGQRATGQGFVIRYVPQMKVYHPARESFADLWQKWDRHIAHFYVEARSRPGGRFVWALKTLAMSLSPLAELPQILTSDRIEGWRSRMFAFAGLLRVRLYRARVMLWLLCGGDPAILSQRWNRQSA